MTKPEPDNFTLEGFTLEEFLHDLKEQNKKEGETSDLKELISAIEDIYTDKNLEKKTRLSHRNEKGIIQLLALNKFYKSKYKFRNRIFDEIIIQKCRYCISLNGEGRKEMLEIFKSLSGAIGNEKSLTFFQRLFNRG